MGDDENGNNLEEHSKNLTEVMDQLRNHSTNFFDNAKNEIQQLEINKKTHINETILSALDDAQVN